MNLGPSSEEIKRYIHNRRAFYARFPDFWADTNGREYALYEVYSLSASEATAIREAAAAIWHIYTRVADLLRSLSDDALLLLGLPAKTLEVARTTVPGLPETVIGRVDLARTPAGYRLMELNADTPYCLYECFVMNGLVCGEFGRHDVNEGDSSLVAEALAAAILASLRFLGRAQGDRVLIAFTSHAASEDRGNAEYLRSLVNLPASVVTRYIALNQLRIDANGLYSEDWQRIDVLYRLYPLEYFATDRDPATGADVGAMLLDLVRQRRLALINPPSAFLLQSKAVQAAIWGLYASGQFFDTEERALVSAHFLPTYLDPLFEGRHVVKPIYGREGNTVSVIDPARSEMVTSAASTFAGQPMVYQQYVELPEIELMTEEGVQHRRLLTSCFLAGGRPCGIGFRAGGLITDLTAYYVPAALGCDP